jgi:hypothetical protein
MTTLIDRNRLRTPRTPWRRSLRALLLAPLLSALPLAGAVLTIGLGASMAGAPISSRACSAAGCAPGISATPAAVR